MTEYPYLWTWHKYLSDRKRQRCRVLVRGTRMNSCALEFEDGYRVITSRNGLGKAKPEDPA